MKSKTYSEFFQKPREVENFSWEVFHENAKLGRFDRFPSNEAILTQMSNYPDTTVYRHAPEVPLPRNQVEPKLSLHEAITTRVSSREMKPEPISLEELTALLHYAYGINRDNEGTGYMRPFRNVPSGGGLYPLDLYVHSTAVKDLGMGIYHYSPPTHSLRYLNPRNETARISKALVQNELAFSASVIIFITAVFERSFFKYKDRSYRFILLEAGHVAQNINLVATGLGLGCVNIGGYFDREIDDILGLDGLTHSTLYMVGIGHKP